MAFRAPLALLIGWGYSAVSYLLSPPLDPPHSDPAYRVVAFADLVVKVSLYSFSAYVLTSSSHRITRTWMLSAAAVVLMAGFEWVMRWSWAGLDPIFGTIAESLWMSKMAFVSFPLLGFVIGIVLCRSIQRS